MHVLLRLCIWTYLITFICCLLPSNVQAAQSITVNLPSRTIQLFVDNKFIKEFPVAVGKISTPTPLGDYSIILKEKNPTWYIPDQPGKTIPSGPDNPLGYRWIGFWKDYGIHGTNIPDSIGNAVSNGCIRMYEEDVEELFDLVSYGAPVKITYEQIQIRENGKGQLLLAVYPDIYARSNISLQDIRSKLIEYNVSELINDELLKKMLREPSDEQVVIANYFKIQMGNRLLNEHGIALQDIKYLPVNAFTSMLGRQIKYDDKGKTLQFGSTTIPYISVGKVNYISVDNLAAIFSGKPIWKPDDNILFFDKQGVYINDKPVNLDVAKIQGMLAVPVLSLAEAFNRKVSWKTDTQEAILTINGKTVIVPTAMINGIPYIKITNINEYFEAYVYWNQKANTIEFTYP